MKAMTEWLEKDLVGKTITAVLPLPGGPMGWFEEGVVLVLDDGTKVVPMRDPEGNGPGALMVQTTDDEEAT